MRVVIPVQALHVGGGCRVLADTANALTDGGHDVQVVIPAWAPVEYELRCKVLRVGSLDATSIPNGDMILANYYTTFSPAYQVSPTNCVRLSLGFEPLWVADPHVAQWTYQQGVPTISISHWLENQIFAASGKRSRVVNLGVDRHVFHPKGEKRHHRRKIILYIARDPDAGYQLKGFSDFSTAMQELTKTYPGRFVVHLICPERELHLPGIAHKVFQPKTDRELAHLYRQADIFVSTSWFEGFALPPLEAMACGTPVVTTDSGGIRDFCRHQESAYITPPKDPSRLASAIKRVLTRDELKRRIIQGGLLSAQEHTQSRFARRIVRALEAIDQERKRHPSN